eukprot:CAMPEP_0117450414 /NCGR_PEP_ID=MMETSP0759-20121206/8456_1 /TAXON_ID=63605 /ORGANISM="Percolomonas cosmopolitus, Strain WS" /LENGTH=660 /DNA_ID=CAMNT_0005242935 /DNA_START=132 /DNA_END=2114 /DNA_ORIENTATION=-
MPTTRLKRKAAAAAKSSSNKGKSSTTASINAVNLSNDLKEYIKEMVASEEWIRNVKATKQRVAFQVDLDFLEDYPDAEFVSLGDGKYQLNVPAHFDRYTIAMESPLEAFQQAVSTMERKRDEIMKDLADEDNDDDAEEKEDDMDIEDDDELDDTEQAWTDTSVGITENVFQSVPQKKEVLYDVLNLDQVAKKQTEMIHNVSETLFMKESHARILLQTYKWNVESILNKFFEAGKEEVLENVGLSEKSFEEVEEDDSTEPFECPSCFEEVSMRDTSQLKACGHRFCNTCWTQFLILKIQEREKSIGCMFWKCKYACDEDFVRHLVPEDMFKSYETKMLESFVDDSNCFTWCSSTPHCGHVICSKFRPNTPLEIVCTCGHYMCYSCNAEPHLPVSCELVKKWIGKCEDDSETMKWLNVNTKDCPDCGTPTDKNGGCNHITCIKCKSHWCWACRRGGFTSQTVYSHKCPGYKENDDINESRQSLQRYLHYFDRYNTHQGSRKFELQTRTKVQDKINEMYRLKPNSAWIEQLWLRNSLDVLFITRRALQYSYVLAFYLFDETTQKYATQFSLREFKGKRLSHMRELFEDTQSKLENQTERLSELMDKPIGDICSGEKMKQEIVTLSVACEKRMEALFDLIRQEFVNSNYTLPDFRHVVTSAAEM